MEVYIYVTIHRWIDATMSFFFFCCSTSGCPIRQLHFPWIWLFVFIGLYIINIWKIESSLTKIETQVCSTTRFLIGYRYYYYWRSSEVKCFHTIRNPIHEFLSNFYWHPLYLSRTVSDLFDFKLFRVWPWHLTFKNHLRSHFIIPFERLYETSFLTSIDTLSLFCTGFKMFDFKLFRVWPWPMTFKGHHDVISFHSSEIPATTVG